MKIGEAMYSGDAGATGDANTNNEGGSEGATVDGEYKKEE